LKSNTDRLTFRRGYAQELELIQKKIAKSYRQRVEVRQAPTHTVAAGARSPPAGVCAWQELNKSLSEMTEHYDIPRVSAGPR
jgi:hypothetical protein